MDSVKNPQPRELSGYVTWALDTHVKAGRFQYLYLLLLGLSCGLPVVHTYSRMFVTTSPSWHEACKEGLGVCRSLKSPDDCVHVAAGNGVSIDQWVLNEPGISVVGDFKLVCESEKEIPMLGSVFFAGFAIGVVVCGSVSDRVGRRWGYLLSYLVLGMGGFMAACSPSVSYFAAAQVLLGFGVAGSGLVSFVWATECLDKQLRPLMAWVPNVMYSLGQMLDSPLAYYFTEWRHYLFAIHAISLIPLFFWPFMHESPAWLASKGRGNHAHDVLCIMAEINGTVQPPPPLASGSKDVEDIESEDEDVEEQDILSQLCDPRLRYSYMVVCFNWFSVSFAFYGVGMFAPNLPFDLHVANVVSALVGIPFAVISQFLIEARWCGRKGAVAGSFVIGGVCLVLSSGIRDQVTSLVVFYLANGALSLAFGVIYIWAAELLPTNIRTRAMSYQSVCARFGAIVSPYVVQLGSTNSVLALMIFAAPCLLSGALDTMLPETRGMPLPNSLDEIDSDEERSEDAIELLHRHVEE
eukprot:TRINITY_DN4656_c0_g1_i2.p1 TRINITY_DN4656_c0_g1~~TRINITY_DN4656_c0_g1_i2.p1  ORF type:complete len:542 (+),score=53.57 TRINITY_DN4656_c0_g1_i2:60-1628(+)